MDKVKLIEAICESVEKDLQALKNAARAAYEAATGPESKSENQYDTRGLEASYLAGAQAKRVAELEEVLIVCRATHPKNFQENEIIAPTALVEVESKGKQSQLLIIAKGAGITLSFENQTIQTITATSPLGDALIGLKKGDIAEVENGNLTREYRILSVQ